MIHSAGVIVIDWNSPTPTVLCVRAYANWDFPKGRLEPGESHFAAACRELQEETSLVMGNDVAFAGVTAPSVTYGRGKKTKTASYFIGDRIGSVEPFLPVQPELGKPENDEYRWVPVCDLHTIMPARLSPVVSYVQDWSGQGKSD